MCGEIAGIANLYHCAGFCGHGIVRSPVVGAIMADLILEGRERYDLEDLRADRYADVPGLQDPSEISAAGVRSYTGHYGKRDRSLN
jgi:glycine/D-amino acid oxidase-like deaminating enzyme